MPKRVSFDVEFWLTQTVFLRLAADREPGMVTGYQIGPFGIMYEISWPCTRVSRHWACEITDHYIPDYARDTECHES